MLSLEMLNHVTTIFLLVPFKAQLPIYIKYFILNFNEFSVGCDLCPWSSPHLRPRRYLRAFPITGLTLTITDPGATTPPDVTSDRTTHTPQAKGRFNEPKIAVELALLLALCSATNGTFRRGLCNIKLMYLMDHFNFQLPNLFSNAILLLWLYGYSSI